MVEGGVEGEEGNSGGEEVPCVEGEGVERRVAGEEGGEVGVLLGDDVGEVEGG